MSQNHSFLLSNYIDMANIKARLFLSVMTLIAFLGPFAAVVAVENAKRVEQVSKEQEAAALAKKDADEARYQYYLGIAQRREDLRKAMADAKKQYEQLLKDQPGMIDANKQSVTQTIIEPVVTQKIVEQPVTTTKPKSSSKTKTS